MPMRNSAIIMLLFAIMIGGGTVWMLRDFLETRATMGQAAQEPGIETTRVVVARQALNFGDTLRPELLKEVDWPSDSIPADSFSSVAVLLEGSERRVALRSIEPNEPVLKQKISGFGGRATLSHVISEDMRAVTIRVNDVIGVGGFILPGDKVDILLTHQPDEDSNKSVTDVLIQNVRVLAVDQTADDRADNPVVAKAATVEVTPEQAQKLSLAASIGSLTLTLRNIVNSEDGDHFSSRTIGITDLTSTQQADGEPANTVTSTVNLYRGTDEHVERVKREPDAKEEEKKKADDDRTSSLGRSGSTEGARTNVAAQ